MEASLPARIDIKLLLENIGGNEVILPKLFQVFWKSSNDCMLRLETALCKKDKKIWYAAAHELKGAALSITARRIANLCEEAERVAEFPSEEATSVLYHLSKEVAALRNELGDTGL